VGKRNVTLKGALRLINDVAEEMFPMDRISAYRRFYAPKYFDMEDYFPTKVIESVEKLSRKGLVEINVISGKKQVTITEKGKKQILKMNLEDLRPKTGNWDGKWRIVLFDIEEKQKRKRDILRKYLNNLGFKEIQKSVYLSPFDCESEVKYIREVLEIPNFVKFGVLESFENNEELKLCFGLDK
jgi:DNA-binding transcriptional regulator PaaX